jgi:type III secretion system (T3SS) SseB-like protein
VRIYPAVIVEFTPANDLEQTLVRAATDPAARPEFYRRLLAAELYVLTEDARASDGQTSKPAGADAKFITWESPSGAYVPLFSSRERVDEIARLRERAYGFVAMSGKAAFARLAQEKRAAFLNPGFACGKQFVPDVVDRLAGGEKAVPQRDTAEVASPPEATEGEAEKLSKPWWKIW